MSRNKKGNGRGGDGQNGQAQAQNSNTQLPGFNPNYKGKKSWDPTKAGHGQQNNNNQKNNNSNNNNNNNNNKSSQKNKNGSNNNNNNNQKNNNNNSINQNNNWNNKNQNDAEYYQKQIAELAAKAAKLDKDKARAERETAAPSFGDSDIFMDDYDDGVYELRVQTARVEYVKKPTAAAPALQQVQQAAPQQASQPFQQHSQNFVPQKSNSRPRCDNCLKDHELEFCFDHVKGRLEVLALEDTRYKVQNAAGRSKWLSHGQIIDLEANGERLTRVSNTVLIQCGNCDENHYQRNCPNNEVHYTQWLLDPRNNNSWENKRFLFPNLVGQIRRGSTMLNCEYCNTLHAPDPEYSCQDRDIFTFLQYIWHAPKRSRVPTTYDTRCQHCHLTHTDEQPCRQLYSALRNYHCDFITKVLGKTGSKSHNCLFCYAGPHADMCDAQLEQTWKYIINAPKWENYKNANSYAMYPMENTPFGPIRRDFLLVSAHYVTEKAKVISAALENTFKNE